MSIANIAKSYAKRFAYKKVSDSGLTSGINFKSVTPENVTGILSTVNGKVNGLNLEMDSDVMDALSAMDSGTDVDLEKAMQQSDIDINSMSDEMGVDISQYVNDSSTETQSSSSEMDQSVNESNEQMDSEIASFDMDMDSTINDMISEYDPRRKAEDFLKSSWNQKSLDGSLLDQYKVEAQQLLDKKVNDMQSEMEQKTNDMMASQNIDSGYSNINYM